MNIGLISKRYAKALLAFSQESHLEETVFQEMMLLEKTLRKEPTLLKALDNPILGVKDKRKLLLSVVNNPSSAYSGFMDLVLKNRRESLLRFIALTFEGLYRQSKNINSGTLITAAPADKVLLEKIRAIFQKVKPGYLELETELDPTIGGGFIFDFDTYRLDASVKTQLNLIKKQFIAENSRKGY
ncbi:MAG: ATP synthase F1 subunit delta [Bacteroidales bacterium 45-6]|nr:MAG: ATP synthase F1 subunit delta [Bacteroidales bacterium 45-6]